MVKTKRFIPIRPVLANHCNLQSWKDKLRFIPIYTDTYGQINALLLAGILLSLLQTIAVFGLELLRLIFLYSLRFDLTDFPFDFVDFEILLECHGQSVDEVRLKWDKARYHSPHKCEYGGLQDRRIVFEFPLLARARLITHGIDSIEMHSNTFHFENGSYDSLSVVFAMVRFPEYYMWKFFLVLYMIWVLSLSPALFSFANDNLHNRMDFTLSSFLAIAATLFFISQDLPRSGYLTLTDKVATLTFGSTIFTGLHSIVTYLYWSKGDEELAQKIDVWGVVMIASIYILWNIKILGSSIYCHLLRRRKAIWYPIVNESGWRKRTLNRLASGYLGLARADTLRSPVRLPHM